MVLVVIALLVGAHWYLWRRLVHDTTAPGSAARRLGTAALVVLPLLAVGALTSGRSGAPFWVQQVLAWPGHLWLATLLYLLLALAVGEAVRPFLRRALDRREARAGAGTGTSTAGTPGRPVSAGAGARARAASGGTGADGDGSASDAPAGTVPAAAAAAGPAAAGTPVPGAGKADAQAAGLASVTDTAGAAATLAPAAPDGGTGPSAPAGAATLTPTAASAPASPSASAPRSAQTGGVTTGSATAGSAPVPEPAGASAAVARPSRRLFVSRVVGGAAAAAALGTVGYGTYGVLRGPRLKRVTVPLAKLPRAAHGFRIAVVSDIHLGPTLGRAHTLRIVDTINSARPDLIAVVGDMVDGTVQDLGPAAEPLAGLEAPHGAFFVTGNHEYFSGADAWVDHVRELGMRPLENERVEIAGFDLAGVNDVAGESEGAGPDFAKALGDRDRGRASVLLAHQPIVIDDAVEHGVDLQLSGHTHGGQLWPGSLLAGLANPTVAGLERYGDTQLYVSRGAGAWGPPVRVGAPSDITIVQLASRQA
ncbi:metallophosphoesterase [Streptomyces sp. NPDC001780]